MDIISLNDCLLPDFLMSDKDKADFAEALAYRYIKLTQLADSRLNPMISNNRMREQGEGELERLSKILHDLPEEIQTLVKQHIDVTQNEDGHGDAVEASTITERKIALSLDLGRRAMISNLETEKVRGSSLSTGTGRVLCSWISGIYCGWNCLSDYFPT